MSPLASSLTTALPVATLQARAEFSSDLHTRYAREEDEQDTSLLAQPSDEAFIKRFFGGDDDKSSTDSTSPEASSITDGEHHSASASVDPSSTPGTVAKIEKAAHGLSTAQIAGIAVGVFAFGAVAGTVITWLCMKRDRANPPLVAASQAGYPSNTDGP